MSDFFKELMESATEAVEISQGKKSAAQVTRYELPDVKAIRKQANMKQDEFAQAIGVSSSLVQAWEQNRRIPTGTCLKVLRVIERNPEMVSLFKTA
ncbi:NadS family protein [Citrobacter sedlakii]|uniref:NadS family protein n=1 Tax=Citrobacter sedlakii TaxID=67826 RepID=UPI001BAA547B|nr:NadS family protein [Citrobacter sedlakii]EKJ8219812.1 helix-turn-helix domain-containing protein [Citrobacter sedlakii]QUC30404.1 helix-turn-helix domain-containing protein [Citrobacter sedlakii]HCT5820196.1 helix-turn-helix domain-containing protein [Citrobacter sedlakii]